MSNPTEKETCQTVIARMREHLDLLEKNCGDWIDQKAVCAELVKFEGQLGAFAEGVFEAGFLNEV